MRLVHGVFDIFGNSLLQIVVIQCIALCFPDIDCQHYVWLFQGRLDRTGKDGRGLWTYLCYLQVHSVGCLWWQFTWHN